MSSAVWFGYTSAASRCPGVNCVNGSQTPWTQDFTYNAFGNLTQTGSSSFTVGYSSGNHISGFTYDGNGDLTMDGNGNSYTYDVEGRPYSAGGVTTIYDAFNRPVELQTGSSNTEILYSPDGLKFAFMNGTSVVKYMAPLTAGLLAVYTSATPAPPAYWRHADWLGSERLASTPSQTLYYGGAYAPFGQNYAETGTRDRDFTGQTQDSVVGSYDFLFRQLRDQQGRWMVPDPAGLAAVDITNPQTWNRYAYVHNNPLSNIDPKGLDDCATYDDPCNGGGGAAGGPPLLDFNVEPYYTGEFSGTWTQAQENELMAQQFWQKQGLYQELPSQQNPAGQSAYWAGQYTKRLLGDPCVYLNNAGTGVESVDHNSSPGECGATGGQWVPPQPFGTTYGVTNGIVSVVHPCSIAGKLNSANSKATKVFGRDMGVGLGTAFLFGCGIGAPAGAVFGPFGAIAGCVGGGLESAGDELLLTTLAGGADASMEAYSGAFNGDCD